MGPHGPFELKIGMTVHYWMKVPSVIDGVERGCGRDVIENIKISVHYI